MESDIGFIAALLLAHGVIMGAFTSTVASAKNLDTLSWGASGAVFGIVALIAVAGMPALQKSSTDAIETGAKDTVSA